MTILLKMKKKPAWQVVQSGAYFSHQPMIMGVVLHYWHLQLVLLHICQQFLDLN
jgi:hypothetical protein